MTPGWGKKEEVPREFGLVQSKFGSLSEISWFHIEKVMYTHCATFRQKCII